MQHNESLHQLAFELGGTEGGNYLLTADDLNAIIQKATCTETEIGQLKGVLHLAKGAIGEYKWGQLTKDIELLTDGGWASSELLLRASAILGSQGCTVWDELANDLRAVLTGPSAPNNVHEANQETEFRLSTFVALGTFVNKLLDISFAGGDADGGHIQELATELGLLIPQLRESRCEQESCECAAHVGFPTTCFVRSKALLASLRPGQEYFGALPDNLESHRYAWMEALSRLHALEPEVAVGEADDKSYWAHELKAMHDMYTDLDRLKGISVASTSGPADCPQA